ncbi:Hint domain-containing protein [Gluconobacter cerinus]|uniref:Hint domain-containing protein n=1 Tax=Gluconobacter cerinus TaxID=38307 RepID=UPI001B8C218C|nr:Hint domain-containing protein [Gluconobacter cerinus]MBS0983057.1 Hint domain-containing protein [Gluconobacter cerinus]
MAVISQTFTSGNPSVVTNGGAVVTDPSSLPSLTASGSTLTVTSAVNIATVVPGIVSSTDYWGYPSYTYPAGHLIVENGGSVVSASLLFNATETVETGGIVNNTLMSGGIQTVYGQAQNTTVKSFHFPTDTRPENYAGPGSIDAQQIIGSGGTAEHTLVQTEFYEWGGSEHFITNASQTVLADGTAIDTTLVGTADIHWAMMDNTFWMSSIASQTVSSGGTVYNTTIQHQGSSYIASGGIAYNTVLSGTDPYYPYFPTLNSTIASTYLAQQTVDGTAYNTIVQHAGYLALNGTASGLTVSSGGTVVATSGAHISDAILEGGTLVLGSGVIRDTIQVLGGGSIDFGDIAYDAGPAISGEISTAPDGQQLLQVTSAGADVATVILKDGFTSPFYFQQAPDGKGTDLIFGTPCYCPGTLIATPDGGERLVEDLAIGDLVLTASGETRPIRWIGRRTYDPIFAYGNRDILPVLFQAGSLGHGLPRRDLRVSPLHAMMLEGYLIPALHLINDLSILQIEKPSEIRYIHIELESHDVLLAEGAPSESFLDDNSRGMFHNAGEYDDLYPETSKQPPRYCAPRLEDGPELAHIYDRLKQHAQHFSPRRKAA